MRIREAVARLAAAGVAVRLLGSTIVPVDEALLCLIDAPSEAVVRLISDQSGVSFERVSLAVAGPTSRRPGARRPTSRMEVPQ